MASVFRNGVGIEMCGLPSVFHSAICASVVMTLIGSHSRDMGSAPPSPTAVLNWSRRKLPNLTMSSSRKGLVKGPTYEMKAEASSTSPVSRSLSAVNCLMLMPQRSFSDDSAPVSRCARLSFFSPRATLSRASCFSIVAASNSLLSLSSLACSSATVASTAANRVLALLSCSFASRSA